MNLSIHQYRVTPLRSSAELHLGVGHGTRHDLFLPSLLPLRHPTRKVVSGGELLSSALVPRKVREIENCLARLCLADSFEPLSLSSFTVSVCRELYMKRDDTSSSFLKKFSKFLQIFCKALKNQCQKFALFCAENRISRESV